MSGECALSSLKESVGRVVGPVARIAERERFFCAVLVPSAEPNQAFLSLTGPKTKTA